MQLQTIKITIETEAQLEDALSDYLIGMFEAAVEFEVAENKTGETVLHGFLQKELASNTELEQLAEQIRGYGAELATIFTCSAPRISVSLLENQDWSEKWKTHFKPFAIIPGLVIAPTWEPYSAIDSEQVIVMDPGMAFGTGHHATTRLCLEFLRDIEFASMDGTVLDVGTGTGILGMAALLFGASRVVAIDNDEEAVKAARSNAGLNKLSDRLEVSDCTLSAIKQSYQVVVANIVHDVLLDLSDELARVTVENGFLILSGLICGDQSTSIRSCFEKKGFRLVEQKLEDQWCALKLKKISRDDC